MKKQEKEGSFDKYIPTLTAVFVSSSEDLLGRLATLKRLALLRLFMGVCRERGIPATGELGIDCGVFILNCSSIIDGRLTALSVSPCRFAVCQQLTSGRRRRKTRSSRVDDYSMRSQ